MGTHPIFESDFDCLTDILSNPIVVRFDEDVLNLVPRGSCPNPPVRQRNFEKLKITPRPV